MARTNLCKVCGWTGEPTEDQCQYGDCENVVARKWLGANHNLCSACVREPIVCDGCKQTLRHTGGEDELPYRSRSIGASFVGLLALSAVAGAIPKVQGRRARR